MEKIKRAKEANKLKAKKDLVDLNALCPACKRIWSWRSAITVPGRLMRSECTVSSMPKMEVYQECYDFALNQLQLPADHPLRQKVTKPDSDDEDDDGEE